MRTHLVLGLLALVTAIASMWPLAAHVSDHVVDGARLINPSDPTTWHASMIGADVFQTVWIVNWVLRALLTQPLHLFDANIFYPADRSLAHAEHLFATALLAAPGAVLGSPVLAHQSAMLLCGIANVWVTGVVVLRWTGSLVGAGAAGVLFAASPFHYHERAHLQSLGTQYFPILLLGLERFAATGLRRWAALAGGGLALQMLSGQYLGYLAVIAWVVGGALALLVGRATGRPLRRLLRDGATLGMVSAAAALLVLLFSLPYVLLAAAHELPDNLTHHPKELAIASVVSLWGYVVPDLFQRWVRVAPAAWPLVLLGLAALVRGDRSARLRAGMLVAIGVVGALLSLGLMPGGLGVYRFCAAVIPGFRSMREPMRAALLPHLAAAMLAGCGAALLARSARWPGTIIASSLLALSLASYWPGLTPLRAVPVGEAVPEAYRFLARCGGGDPLLELPAHAGGRNNWRDAERMFFSTSHWLPILNGRASYPPRLFEPLMQLADRLPSPEAWSALRDLSGARWVLVHCDGTAEPTFRATWCSAQAPWDAPSRTFGSARLFDLGPVPTLPRPWPPRRPVDAGCDA